MLRKVDDEFDLLGSAMAAAFAAIPKFTRMQLGQPPLR